MNAANIKMIVFDVDGVMTDGGIYVDDRGTEMKRFHVRDGFAVRAAKAVGLKIGVLTGRSTGAVNLRMTELGVDVLMQGCSDKAIGFENVCRQASVLPREAAYVGDDLIDLPAMLLCGYPIAVADAVDEVRAEAEFVTQKPGGHGAVREAVEHLLKLQGKWDEVVERYVI